VIRILLPHHLQTLARCGREVTVTVDGPVTQRSVLDALESRYPMLRGTVRDHVTQKRRPMIRFFADGKDVTGKPPDEPLPQAIASGEAPFFIVGAIAGG
jgi:molybdopterin synthase sulfur carrier subunit